MHEEFWHARWSSNEIGFHLNEVNPYLIRFWPELALPAGSRVLVPLCGKSLDLRWLVMQGYPVLGVELSRKAVEDFFAEQSLDYRLEEQGDFIRYCSTGLEILCGDFFALTAADVAQCTAVFDRAAMIALPPDMRSRYVNHLAGLLAPGCRGLLVTLEYPQELMPGPPFSVPEQEVRDRLMPSWRIEHLLREDVLKRNWRFAERGLSDLHESVYRLTHL